MNSRSISNILYLRMIGYSIIIPMHIINGLVMELGFYGDVMKDPNIRQYYVNRTRFISCWVFVGQIIYAVTGLYCDIKTIQNAETKESKKLKLLRKLREFGFTNIIVPYTCMVTAAFWVLYVYDKNLILPAFMNKVVSSLSNHILHTGILFVIIWEIAVLPRTIPKSHGKNLAMLALFSSIYLFILYLSHYQLGLWAYPILNYLNGTIYFNIFIGTITASLLTFYFLQWHITNYFWGEVSEKIK